MNEMQELSLESLNSTKRVQGLTHNFYRYPARFSPEFAKEVVKRFSQKGDCVLDAFMGGGTTVIEAIATGRRVIGIDVNSLAYFVTLVKTTPLSKHDEDEIIRWSEHFQLEEAFPNYQEIYNHDERLRNLPDAVREFITPAVESLTQLHYARQRRFARCALLKIGQWAVDCRQSIPTKNEIKTKLIGEIRQMLYDMERFVESAREAGICKNKITDSRALIQGAITDPNTISAIMAQNQKPTLVLTSPPYPGVHVLYHRWQISGRKETPAPYWFAGLQDGRTASYYTMGGRSDKGLREYFENLREAFHAIRSVIDPSALVIQLVGFSDKESQLPVFLAAMDRAGYKEVFFEGCPGLRQSRNVPHRKWYTHGSKMQDTGQEVLLCHRPRY
jgi:hypothetical protein